MPEINTKASKYKIKKCKHPSHRLYSWFSKDRVLCVCCCECGEVLKGGVK